MKIPIYTSVVSVFIQVKNLVSSENGWTSLNFTHPRVVLTPIHKFKMSVNLLESKLYFYSYTILDEESEFTFSFPQKSTDNIFKMALLSVKRSIPVLFFMFDLMCVCFKAVYI